MKEIYTIMQAHVKNTVPELRWIDFDMGQLDEDLPPVAYPCMLIDFVSGEFDRFGGSDGAETILVEITLAYQLRERTSNITPTPQFNEALEHLDLNEKVRQKLEGLEGQSFTPFAYSGFEREKRSDLRVYLLRFTTNRYPLPPADVYQPWTTAGGTGASPGLCIDTEM